MRNIINRGTQQASPEEDNDANHTPQHEPGARIAGGAPGIAPDGDSSVMGGGNVRQYGAPGPKVRRYRVVTGGFLMHNNCRVAMRAGKEIGEHQYDIAQLKKQGIRLEEITDDEPVVPPIPVEVQPRRPASLAPGGEAGTPEANAAPAGDPAAAPPPAQAHDTPEEAEQRKRRR